MAKSIAGGLMPVKHDLQMCLLKMESALKNAVEGTERTRLEIAIKDIKRGIKTLNLIICDSPI